MFKLHSPLNFIAGGGFFIRHTALPLSIVWECFGKNNGANSLNELRQLIRKTRRNKELDPVIGCTILTEPFFLEKDEWIPAPQDWSSNIVTGKTYDTDQVIGGKLWDQLENRLRARKLPMIAEGSVAQPRYSSLYLARARLGQGAFRVLVTDAYKRRCSITGERTLPVLEAAHIVPFSKEGPNRISNGLLLRSDLHILFDKGYITVTPDLQVEVSPRIREEFENGRDYYVLHGQRMLIIPDRPEDRPDSRFIEWHNDNVFAA